VTIFLIKYIFLFLSHAGGGTDEVLLSTLEKRMSRESDFARNRLQLLTQALDRWISSASVTLILPSLPVIIIRITKSDNDSIGNSIMALKLLAATTNAGAAFHLRFQEPGPVLRFGRHTTNY